jgi:2-phosphosulfolactate phosphatase
MRIETILTPAEISLLTPEENAGWTCVVFDILRATTSIVTAIAHDAQLVKPVRTIEEALACRNLPNEKWLLGGERHGNKIDGFDLGNSPLEYLDVANQNIVTTTTNGTVALDACRGADCVYAASLLNLSATADYLRKQNTASLRILCAGTFENFALEDAVAAGLLIQHFPEAGLCDASIALRHLIESPAATWAELIQQSKNGCALQKANRSQDIEWALRLDAFPVVVTCDPNGCRRLSKD